MQPNVMQPITSVVTMWTGVANMQVCDHHSAGGLQVCKFK